MNSGNSLCEGQIHSIPSSLHFGSPSPFDCVDLFNLQNSCRSETFLLNTVRANFLSRRKPVCRSGRAEMGYRDCVTGMKHMLKILENKIPDRGRCLGAKGFSPCFGMSRIVYLSFQRICVV
ncbi:hypothetical protein CEXT_232381 [Caerostris extrusa]|uniref:Uncharacterized protein n=1 Tax=Caerostris extrusa TaxID=172846 RepID=A0AAV4N7N4_CAEEX|nr:hypothetical protein CEXT_232381 [Caerostris extrusa]